MTRQCTQCASLLEDGATVCAHCGVPAAEPASPAVAENFVSEAVSGQTIEPLAAPIDSPAQPPIKPPVFSSGDDLDGIGGWLLLSAFGLAFAPFLIAHNVYGDLKVLFGARYQPGLSIHPGLAGMVMFEAVTNSLFLAAVLALNYLLYNRKKSFPGCMIAYFIAQIVWVLGDHLMAMHFSPKSDWTTLLRSLLAGVLWIPYYLQSRRVELTFVNE